MSDRPNTHPFNGPLSGTTLVSRSGVFRGGGTGRWPPLWPEHKNFLNTLNQKKFNFWGGGTAPSPDPFFSGEGTPPPHTLPHWRLRCLEPRVFSSGPPFHKILNTPLVSRYEKGKPICILLKQETVSGSGISWAICKSAPCSKLITTPAPHHSVFYRADALPAVQPMRQSTE